MPDDLTPAAIYTDEDLVYVDPETRTVIGKVEWDKNDNPKALLMPERAPTPGKERRRGGGKRFYPWGTYRSMKNMFRLEGKRKKEEPTGTLDEIMVKALREPYWD